MSGQLGELVISLQADLARFREDMGKAAKIAQDSSKNIAAGFGDVTAMFGKITTAAAGVSAVLAGGAMFGSFISKTKEVSGEVVKLSKVFGISAEKAGIMRIALDDALLTTDEAVAASDRLTRASIKNASAFKAAGIDIRDNNGNLKDSMTVMMGVNDYLLTLKEGKDRDTAAMSLYGKGWRELSGILRLTSEGMKEAKNRAEDLHLIFGDDKIKMVKDYKLAMKDLDDVAESMQVTIGTALIPVLTELAVVLGDVGTSAANTTGNVLKEKLRDWKDFNAGVSQIIRDIGIRADSGEGFERWITKSGRAEVKAELEASNQLYEWQMMKNSEKFGGAVKATKAGGGRQLSNQDKAGGAKGDKDSVFWAGGGFMNWRAEQLYLEEEARWIKDKEKLDAEAQLQAEKAYNDYMKFLTAQYDMGPPSGLTAEQMDRFHNDNLKGIMGALDNRSIKESTLGMFEPQDPYKQLKLQYDGERALAEEQISYMEDLNQTQTDAYALAIEKRTLIDEKYAADKKRLDKDMWMVGAASVADSVGRIGDALMKGNKRQFEMGKKMAIASASISMIEGAINAYTSLSKIPYVGPALGAAAAAAAVAGGAARISQIKSMSYDARAMGGPVSAGATYLVGEQGPEIITMGNTGGNVTPNNKLGGNTITVTPVYQISTGVSETVQAEVMRLAPAITQMSVDAVYDAINSGGSMSAAVGRM